MLNYHPISLSDRETVLKYLPSNTVSYFNFSNLYMWRKVMKTELCEKNGILYLRDSYRDDGVRILPPFCEKGREREAIAELDETFPVLPVIRPLTEELLSRFAPLFPDAEITEMRNLDDYIYSSEAMRTLSGRALHKKKNHLNEFLERYAWKYERITEENIGLLLSARDRLYEKGESSDLDDEYEANCELIAHFSGFGLRAGVLTVDGIPVAYTVGERMNEEYALIHIEKADREYEGAYAAINQMFAENEWSGVEYLNREEDMGIEGLRKAKLSYRPAFLQTYYKIVP